MISLRKQLNLSARAYHRILKLARTIAHLAGCEEIHSVHLAEAVHASQSAEVDDELSEIWMYGQEDLRIRSGEGRFWRQKLSRLFRL
jgi:hypothetical protein